jgi:hypothetical protein
MAALEHPPLKVAHRFVDSPAGLAYYARRPGGVMWRQAELFDAPVFYLAFHGKPGTVISLTGDIGAEPLIAWSISRLAACCVELGARASRASFCKGPACGR